MGTIESRLSDSLVCKPRSPEANRILVVEDDPAVQKALKRMHQIEGFTVDTQSDGLAALVSFHNNIPSAVILDLRLPGLSGRDLCRQMKAAAPSIPIIILSASNDTSDNVLLLELGADDYVTRPFLVHRSFSHDYVLRFATAVSLTCRICSLLMA